VAQVPLKLGYKNRVAVVAQNPRENGIAKTTAMSVIMRAIRENCTSAPSTMLTLSKLYFTPLY
jgi:hypothetical protein